MSIIKERALKKGGYKWTNYTFFSNSLKHKNFQNFQILKNFKISNSTKFRHPKLAERRVPIPFAPETEQITSFKPGTVYLGLILG